MGTKGSEEGGPCKMILGRERAVWEGGRARWRCLNPDLRGAAAQAMSRSGCPPTPGQAEVPGDDGMEERRGQHVARGVSHGAHEGHVEQGEEGPGRPQNLLRMNSCVRVCDPRDRGAGTTEV